MTTLMLLKDNVDPYHAARFLGAVIPAINRVVCAYNGDNEVQTFQQVMEAMRSEAEKQATDKDLRRALFTVKIVDHRSFTINETVIVGYDVHETRIDLMITTETGAPEFSSPAALVHGWKALA